MNVVKATCIYRPLDWKKFACHHYFFSVSDFSVCSFNLFLYLLPKRRNGINNRMYTRIYIYLETDVAKTKAMYTR